MLVKLNPIEYKIMLLLAKNKGKIYSSKKKAKKNKGAIWTKVVQTNSKKIVIKNKKLKNKKTLYIRIRAYKRINRKNKYSTWSEIKKVIVN